MWLLQSVFTGSIWSISDISVWMDPSLSYVDNAVIPICITAIYTLLCLFIPETPRYLVSKGRNEEGYRVLQCIRGHKIDNRLEINEIEEWLSK